MIIISGLALVLGITLIIFGLIMSTDGMEAWHRRRVKPPETLPSVRERAIVIERTVRTRITTAERIR